MFIHGKPFCKGFFFKFCQNSSLSFFLTNSTYKKTPCKRFAFFDIFFIFFEFFGNGEKILVPVVLEDNHRKYKSYYRRLSSGTAGTRKATAGGLIQEPPVLRSYC